MSVMHLTFDMRIGGTEMVIKNLIEGSDPSLFEMSIFCIEEPLGPWGIDLQNSGLKISTKARKPGFDTSLIFAIRKYIKNNKIDILHCHQYTPWVYGVLAAFGTKTKVIFTEHGRFYPDFSSWKRKLINPWLCRITDHLTAISKATKQALVEFENIPAERIEVIYNGIKKPEVITEKVEVLKNELGITKDNIVLGTIARLDPIKNHIMMLEAFALVSRAQPNALLIIVGDGEERNNIENKIQELEIADNVILTGYDPQPQHFLALMDIFLLSSFSEGTSMTLLEAMSLGKPSVVTDAGGNPEIIKNETSGLVSKNNDTEDFKVKITTLITELKTRQNFSHKAEQTFQSMFSLENMIQNFERLYSTCHQSE